MTNQKDNFIESSIDQTPEQAAKNKKTRDSQIKAEKKKASKKAKAKSDDNIQQKNSQDYGKNKKQRECTAKQEAFARQYLVCRCKTAAFKYAYDCSNMKPESINRKGFETYETPIVYARIMELQEESNKRIEITTDKISQGVAKLAFTDLPGIINLEGGLLTLSEFNSLNYAQRACIKKFKVKTEMRLINEVEMKCEFVEIEVYDKHAALVTLAKMNRMLVDKSEVKHSGKITQETVELSKEDYIQARQEMLKNDEC